MPEISIVVPTRGRAAHVGTLLSSLRAAALGDGLGYEIILVDDSSAEDCSLIQEAARSDPVVRFLEGPPSVRAKRNLGWREARADHVLFVDSDCVAQPHLLAAHLACYTGDDVGGAAGVTTFVNGSGWLWESIRRSRFLNGFSFALRFDNVPWATCSNVSYRRSVLNRLDGFDELLPSRLGGDDADFGMRVNEAGLRIASAPAAEVLHDAVTWMSFRALLDRSFRWGRADLFIYYRKRSTRLRRRLFPHVLAVAALLLGVAVAAELAFGWLAVLPVVAAAEAASLTVSSLVTARGAGETRSWRLYVLDEVLGMVFEAGLLSEGLRRGDLRPLVLVPQRGAVLAIHRGLRWAGQTWGLLVLLVALVSLVLARWLS